jgi:hypothetical protein
MKLGDVEGIKARLDKRLGNDELLKVCLSLTELNVDSSPSSLQATWDIA